MVAARQFRQVLTALTCALALARLAHAGPTGPTVDLEPLALQPGGRGSTLVDGAALLPPGTMQLFFAGGWDYEPTLYAFDGKVQGAPITQRFATVFGANVAASRRLQFGVQAPVTLAQWGVALPDLELRAPTARGVGAATVRTRAALAAETWGSPVDAVLDLDVRLPSATSTAPGRDQPLTLIPRFALGTSAGNARLEAGLSCLLRPSFFLGVAPNAVQSAALELGAVYGRHGLGTELDVTTRVPFDGSATTVEVLTGARYALSDEWSVFVLGGPTLAGLPTFTFRAFAGVTFQHPLVAADTSRTLTALEQRPVVRPDASLTVRPTEASALDEPPPPPDSDGDGVLDSADLCPLERGVVDLRGCPPKDLDRDGVVDAEDRCPSAPGPVERDGCPLRDSDDDGVLDEADACPDLPGPVERSGCPLRDRDDDGVDDREDDCPDAKGPEASHGCPIRDRDGDLVPDATDNCPDEKGLTSNAGCPRQQPQLVTIVEGELRLARPLEFLPRGGGLKATSGPLVDQLVKVVRAHAEWSRLVVEVRIDPKADPTSARKEARSQVDSLAKALERRGLPLAKVGTSVLEPGQGVPAETPGLVIRFETTPG